MSIAVFLVIAYSMHAFFHGIAASSAKLSSVMGNSTCHGYYQDRFILQKLHAETDGVVWGPDWANNSSDHCANQPLQKQWSGVHCQTVAPDCPRVTELDLINKGLYGNISAVMNLPYLTKVQITNPIYISCDLKVLSHLNLTDITLISEGITGRLDYLSNIPLSKLDLTYARVEGSLAVLPKTLGILILSGTKITGKLGDLSQMENLSVLNLIGTHISGPLTSLQKFNLKQLKVSGRSIEGNLQDINGKTLKELTLLGTNVIGDLKHINSPKALSNLNLANSNKISGDPKSLRFYVNLLYLNLSWTSVSGNIGFLNNLFLLEVNLNGANISGSLSDLKERPLERLKILKISGCRNISGQLDTLVVNNKITVQILDLGDTLITGRLSDLIVAGPIFKPSVSWLNLSYTMMKGDIADLHKLTLLTLLDLRSTQVEGEVSGIIQLEYPMLYLQHLYLSNISGTLSQVSTFKSLIHLDWSGAPGPSGDVSNLCNMTELKTVILKPQRGVQPPLVGDLSKLQNLTKLEVLNIIDCDVHGDLSSTSNMTHLVSLILDYTKVSGTLSDLSPLTSLAIFSAAQCALHGNLSALSAHLKLVALNLPSTEVNGSLSSLTSMSQLRFLNLGQTKIQGSIPRKIDRMESIETLLIFRNDVTGSIPASLSSLPYLERIYAHDNRLSCLLPDQISSVDSLMVMGNKFKSSLPAWVRADVVDADLLVVHDNELRNILLYSLICIGAIALPSACFSHTKLAQLPWKSWYSCFSVLEIPEDKDYFRLLQSCLIVLSTLTFFPGLVLTAIFLCIGPNFVQCPSLLSHITASSVDDDLSSQLLSGFTFLYLLLVCWALLFVVSRDVKPPSPPSFSFHSCRCDCCCDLILVLLWFFVLLVFTLPTFIFIAVHTMPRNNILSLSTHSSLIRYVFNEYLAPIWIVLVNYIFLPIITRLFVNNRCCLRLCRHKGRYRRGNFILPGVEDTQAFQDSISWRMVIGLLFNTLLCPILATLVFSQDCFRGFFSFWSLCTENSTEFDLKFNLQTWNSHNHILWKTTQTCDFSFRRGHCGRKILDILGPFMLRKCMIEIAYPCWYLIKWSCPQIKKWGYVHYKLQLGNPMTPFVADDQARMDHWNDVDCVVAYAQLFSQLQIALVLGCFIPFLLPISGLVLWSNYIIFLAYSDQVTWGSLEKKQTFPVEANDEYSDCDSRYSNSTSIAEYLPISPKPPLLSIFLSIVLVSLLSVLFFIENQFLGQNFVIAGASIAIGGTFLLLFNVHSHIYVFYLIWFPRGRCRKIASDLTLCFQNNRFLNFCCPFLPCAQGNQQ